MARPLDNFDDIVVRDVQHRHQFQSTSSGNIIRHLYSHVTGNTANVSAAEIVSADGSGQGQWDLLLNTSTRRLVANAITTANAASLTANAVISIRPGNVFLRSANVTVNGNLNVSQTLVATTARFGTCIFDGIVSGNGVTNVVTSGSTDLVTSGGVFTALANVSGGGFVPDPDQPTIRSVGTLTSLNVAGSMVVGGGTLRVGQNYVSVGSVYDGQWVSGVTPAEEKNWNSIAYAGNGGGFVAVGTGGVGNRAMTSPDGVSWTIRPTSADNTWNSVAYGEDGGVFVAVASGGSNRCMTSSNNGQTWVGRACPSSTWTSVAYGQGVFCAVADSGVGSRAMRSTNNGANWTSVTTPADNLWASICYGNGVFCAVSNDGVGNRVMTSPTGEVWTLRTSAADNAWESVCYGNNLFVAVASTGTNRVMTSTNGTTWIQRATPGTHAWSSVAYGAGGLYVAVSPTAVMTSPDGIVWTAGENAVDNNWTGIAYGEGLYVCVSSTGTLNRVQYATGTNNADLIVSNSANVVGDVSVGGGLSVGNVLSVGQSSRSISLRNNSIQFFSNGVVDSSLTTVGATANVGNSSGELVLTGRDYVYAGTTYNNGNTASTGVVQIQAYPLYPVIPDGAQSIRQYALAQRFWSGRVPRNSASPQTLQFFGDGNYGLYGTYAVQYMTKSGTFHNAMAMCMRGSAGSPGNTNALTWQTLSSTTSGTTGLSIAFGAVSNFIPQISLTNTTNVNSWFQISAVVFDQSVLHGEAAT